jgi:hypothetical protein
LIRRLAEIKEQADRAAEGIFTFEEAGLRYLEEIAHKSSADTVAIHLDRLFPLIGDLPLSMVHNGTLKPYVDHQRGRDLSPKTINNGIGMVSAILNRAARVWRTDDGLPWLRQAPPKLTRLSVKGQQAKSYPLSWAEQDRLFRLLPRHLADAALFAVNTGCRETEVCRLNWAWEVRVPELDGSVFVLPETETKTSIEPDSPASDRSAARNSSRIRVHLSGPSSATAAQFRLEKRLEESRPAQRVWRSQRRP